MSYLESESHYLEDKLKSKDSSEDEVENVESMSVGLWFPSKLHCQGDGIEHDEDKDGILKWLWCDEPPDFVLKPVFWDIASNRFGFEGKFYAVSLCDKEEINM